MLNKQEKKPLFNVSISNSYDVNNEELYYNFDCTNLDFQEALEGEVDYWTSPNPILLDAGTGKGKTTFVYKSIIPRALEKNVNILLISNRVALSVQQKYKIMEILDSPQKELLTEKGIMAEENFGNVCVITYHRLPSFLQDVKNKEWLKKLGYVIADEVHFFASDSRFNEKCGYYLKLLTTCFCRAVRIYLTATSWDILNPLARAEEKNFFDPSRIFEIDRSRNFYRYYTEQSFEHVDVMFFDKLENLLPLIEGSRSVKWLIFTDNKEKGMAFAESLGECCIYLDAHKKNTAEWNQLLSDSCFKSQVLVSTAVLDCGVNIIDDNVKNVVIMSDDRTEMIQMLGRKRVRKGERVTLWVHNLSKKAINRRYNDCCQILSLQEEYDGIVNDEDNNKFLEKVWQTFDPSVMKMFWLHSGKILKNEIAFYYLERKKYMYEKILDGTCTFEDMVKKWLGKKEQESKNWHNLYKFCFNNCFKTLETEECKTLRCLILEAQKEAGFVEPQPTRVDTLGHVALSNRLKNLKLSYEIITDGDSWQIKSYTDKEFNDSSKSAGGVEYDN